MANKHPWVADYLSGTGIRTISQTFRVSRERVIHVLRANGCTIRSRGRAPDPYLPKSQGDVSAIALTDRREREEAARCSRDHLKALLRYGARNKGLPNISPEECEQRLQAL